MLQFSNLKDYESFIELSTPQPKYTKIPLIEISVERGRFNAIDENNRLYYFLPTESVEKYQATFPSIKEGEVFKVINCPKAKNSLWKRVPTFYSYYGTLMNSVSDDYTMACFGEETIVVKTNFDYWKEMEVE